MGLKYPYLECGYFVLYGDRYDALSQTLPVELIYDPKYKGEVFWGDTVPKGCCICTDVHTALWLWMTGGWYPAYMKVNERYPTYFLEADGCLYPVGYGVEMTEHAGFSSGSGFGSGSGSFVALPDGEIPDNLRNSDGGWHGEGGYGLELI